MRRCRTTPRPGACPDPDANRHARTDADTDARPDADTESHRRADADTVDCTKPTANFTWTTGGQSNKTYTYRDASTVADPVNCPITDWLWTFTDCGRRQSNAQNPAPDHIRQQQQASRDIEGHESGGSSQITSRT